MNDQIFNLNFEDINPDDIENVIKLISEIQELPISVIIEFLNASGSLQNTGFADRFNNDK